MSQHCRRVKKELKSAVYEYRYRLLKVENHDFICRIPVLMQAIVCTLVDSI